MEIRADKKSGRKFSERTKHKKKVMIRLTFAQRIEKCSIGLIELFSN